MTLGFAMHLGDEWAGGIQVEELAALCLRRHRFRHAMRGKDYTRSIGSLIQLVNEHGTQTFEALDNEAVVDDLMAHIDRRTVFLERQFDNADCPLDTRAEAAWTRQQQLELRLRSRWLVLRGASHGEPAWLQSGVVERRFEKSAAGHQKSSGRRNNGGTGGRQ
jgi:hypothetical protein